MFFRLWVHVLHYICRDQTNSTAMWFYLLLYAYIAYPTRMGKGDICWKHRAHPLKAVELWIELKCNVGELNWIVNWIASNIDGWIESWIEFRRNEHLEKLNLNWIQTLCLNLNWVVNPKKLNRYISGGGGGLSEYQPWYLAIFRWS